MSEAEFGVVDPLSDIARLAGLIRQRNVLDSEISSIIGRPASVGHLGEWIASQIFEVNLEKAANAKGIDGSFTKGELADRTVNIKFYSKRANILDLSTQDQPDYYLVLTGPSSPARSSAGTTAPLQVDAVYLFEGSATAGDLASRGRRVGVASSIPARLWAAAEIYPKSANPVLQITDEQRVALQAFAPS